MIRWSIFLFFISVFHDIQSQENANIPPALDLLKNIQNEYPDIVFKDIFYPVGWSESGLFAYIISPGYEDLRAEGRTLIFNIFDAVNDKTVFSKSIDTYDYTDGKIECSFTDIECAWRDAGFDNELEKYGIYIEKNTNLYELPGNLAIEKFSYKIDNNKLIFISSSYGSKVLTNNFMKNGKIAGFILSPYELRILVISAHIVTEKGSESPNDTYRRLTFRFYGCHLEKGFNKTK